MNQKRLIFYSIFAAYQLCAFIFTLVMESDTGFLFQLVTYIKWFKYGTFIGLLLVAIDFVWWWREGKGTQKEQDALRHENNTLKAKVYDMQEAAKEQAAKAATSK